VKEYINKILRRFKSVRFSAVIIGLLIFIYFLGLIIPQKWMFETKAQYDGWVERNILNMFLDFIGFTNIYLSPLTIFLLGIFFINLIIVISSRIPLTLKRAYIGTRPPSFSVEDIKRGVYREIPLSGFNSEDLLERTKQFFKKRRWYVVEDKQRKSLFALRNRFSPLGFLFFHFSFLLCLIGGLLITYTRFSGNLALTEGQAFNGDIRQFHRIIHEPKVLHALPALGLYLEKIHPFYENDVPVELVVVMKVLYDGKVKREILRVNKPIKRGPLSIIVERIGVSPLFIVRGPSGEVIDGAYVSLNVLNGQEDSFQFDTDRRFRFYVRFFPDYIVENGVEGTRSIELRNPAIHLLIEKNGKTIYNGTIMPGERADMEPFTISFEDIRYWAEFLIVREYGKSPLVAGFILAAIGLIMRLVFYQKRLRLAVEDRGDRALLYIDGRSEYFQYSFDSEVKRVSEELVNFLKGR
jgi:hypothetical protein